MIESGKVENRQMTQGLALLLFFFIKTFCFFPIGFFLEISNLCDPFF